MLRLPMDMGDCSPWESTASAALMKGWISSIFMSGSPARGVGHNAVLTHHVFDDFVQHFRFNRLLHEMARTPLQRRHDVLLVAHRGHHDDARLGMLPHNLLGGLDAFHLWHGDVHEHDVRAGTLVLCYGGHAVARFTSHLSAECFDHAGQVFAGEDGIIHHEIPHRLTVLAAFHWCKLLHIATSSNLNPTRRPVQARQARTSPVRRLRLCRHRQVVTRLYPADPACTAPSGY